MKQFFIKMMLAACTVALTACHPATENSQTPVNQQEQQDTQNNNTSNQTDSTPQKDEPESTNQQENTMTIENGFQMDEFKTNSGKSIKFYCIKHGSLWIHYDNTEFQIDPVKDLDGNVTDYQALPKADYILVTHEHYDHYDKDAINDLSKDSSTLITNQNVAKMFGKGDIMKNGDEKSLRDDIHIKAVPAYNTKPDHQKFHPKGRDNGFILTLDGFRIYIAADTEDIPEMAEIKDIDVAFLPCNQPYTMTPEQLNKAARLIQPKVLFPYHYGKTDMNKVTELLKDSGIDTRIRNYQ